MAAEKIAAANEMNEIILNGQQGNGDSLLATQRTSQPSASDLGEGKVWGCLEGTFSSSRKGTSLLMTVRLIWREGG